MKGFYKSKDSHTWNQGASSTWGESVPAEAPGRRNALKSVNQSGTPSRKTGGRQEPSLHTRMREKRAGTHHQRKGDHSNQDSVFRLSSLGAGGTTL